jgi:hypothetical protein
VEIPGFTRFVLNHFSGAAQGHQAWRTVKFTPKFVAANVIFTYQNALDAKIPHSPAKQTPLNLNHPEHKCNDFKLMEAF